MGLTGWHIWPRRSHTHTECVADDGMTDGCHVFITDNWYLSEVPPPTVVQKCGNSTVRPSEWTASGDAPSASTDLILSALIYVTICHVIIYFELLALSLSALHHVFMLLRLQKQCSWKLQMDLQWLIISVSVIICTGDNTHTCNLFLHQTAVLMMHVWSFI